MKQNKNMYAKLSIFSFCTAKNLRNTAKVESIITGEKQIRNDTAVNAVKFKMKASKKWF